MVAVMPAGDVAEASPPSAVPAPVSPTSDRLPAYMCTPLPHIPVGERLSHFFPEWESQVKDPWVVSDMG